MSTDKMPFDQILDAIDTGESDPDRHVMNQVNRSLAEAVRAAQTSGKAAKVTITLDIKPNAERRVVCSAKVDAKLPRPAVSAANLFADGMGNLYNSDPLQGRLQFTPISGGSAGGTKKDN